MFSGEGHSITLIEVEAMAAAFIIPAWLLFTADMAELLVGSRADGTD